MKRIFLQNCSRNNCRNVVYDLRYRPSIYSRWPLAFASILFCLIISTPFQTLAASFDCKKATAPIEKQICADPGLSVLDKQLAAAYQQALAAATDIDALKCQQREWLTKTRNTCRDEECLKNSYTVRFKELSIIAFTKKGMGLYRCAGMGVSFGIRDGIIVDFYSTSSVSSPDLALGYTNTCIQHIGKFYQIGGGKDYVLQFNSHDDQYGESLNCQVHIEDIDSKFHARSSSCLSECMKFDFEVNKKGNECYYTT